MNNSQYYERAIRSEPILQQKTMWDFDLLLHLSFYLKKKSFHTFLTLG